MGTNPLTVACQGGACVDKWRYEESFWALMWEEEARPVDGRGSVALRTRRTPDPGCYTFTGTGPGYLFSQPRRSIVSDFAVGGSHP